MTPTKEHPMSDTEHFIVELPPLPQDAVVALYETLLELLMAFEHTYQGPIREHYRMTEGPPPQRDLFYPEPTDLNSF